MQVNCSDIPFKTSSPTNPTQSSPHFSCGSAVGTCTGTVVQKEPPNTHSSRPLNNIYNEQHHHSAFDKCLPVGLHKKACPVIIFRPIEAKFNNKHDVGKMDPYCKIKVGWHRGKTSVAKQHGKHPVWDDLITLKVKNQDFAKIKVKDKNRLIPDDILGKAKIPLIQILTGEKITQWVPLNKGGQITGEILVSMEHQYF